MIGYDVQTPASMGCHGNLSGRRELVEQLDSEPLFDYLIQNGALQQQTIDSIRSEKSDAQINLALLRHLESGGAAACSLFINALRQTGQLHLANLLDNSERIRGLSGSGYLSKKRHKGQVSLYVEIKSLRLPKDKPPEAPEDKNLLGSREWLSLDDILLRIAQLTEQPVINQFDLDSIVDDKKKQPSCWCVCFAGLFAKRKTPDGLDSTFQKSHSFQSVQTMSPTNISSGDKEKKYEVRTALLPARSRLELENLNNMADMFRSRAETMYNAMRNPTGATHTALVKFLEQERGILVLNAGDSSDEVLTITSICNNYNQVDSLRRDINSGALNTDLLRLLSTEAVLKAGGVNAMKIKLFLMPDEVETAEMELKPL